MGDKIDLLPCPRCQRPNPIHHGVEAYGFSESVSCPCGIDFDGSAEEWNTRATLSPAADAPHPYTLRPDLQRIVDGAKTAPQWDTERDRLAPAPDAVEALVKAADQSFFELVVDGMAEADRAMRKFPQPNYVISKVAEEAGEVVKAAIHCAEGRETAANVQGEMKQLIAMLYRLWAEGDQVHGLAAIRAGGKP
jgi:hypothetical protein